MEAGDTLLILTSAVRTPASHQDHSKAAYDGSNGKRVSEPLCRPSMPLDPGSTDDERLFAVEGTPQAFGFTVRSFFTDFTPGTCQADQEAWALVGRSATSPVKETTPAFVWALMPAFFSCESFAI